MEYFVVRHIVWDEVFVEESSTSVRPVRPSPLTLTLSRFVGSVLGDSLAGESGQREVSRLTTFQDVFSIISIRFRQG